MEIMWNQEKVTHRVQKTTTLDDYCCNEVDTTDNSFIGKDKVKSSKVRSSIHI